MSSRSGKIDRFIQYLNRTTDYEAYLFASCFGSQDDSVRIRNKTFDFNVLVKLETINLPGLDEINLAEYWMKRIDKKAEALIHG